MDISIHFGETDDIPTIADFVIAAGDGLFEFLLDGIVPMVRARDLIRMAVGDSESVLSFSNALLAERNGVPVGMVLSYPADQYGIPPVVETVVPGKRLAHIRDILDSRIEGTWYVNSLAVVEEARGLGVARLLLSTVADLAGEAGFDALSLHAWDDNPPAIALYRSVGFETVRAIEVAPTERLRHSGTMLLMRAPLPLAG